MTRPKSAIELEVKLPVASLRAARRALRRAGYAAAIPRSLETNTLFDLPDGSLRRAAQTVRLRHYRGKWLLTYKGPGQVTPQGHKARPEYETELAAPEALLRCFEAAGLKPSLRYEKYRTEFRRPGGFPVLLDETPIGVFLELEGPARWIDRTARQLGYRPEDYIAASYLALFAEFLAKNRLPPADMVFGGPDAETGTRKRRAARSAGNRPTRA